MYRLIDRLQYQFSNMFCLVISNHSEKYEFVSWDDDIPKIWKNKSHVPKHQQKVYIFSKPPNRIDRLQYQFSNMFIWVCLKIVYPIVPNGFADHYPYFLWLFHWEYTLFSDKPIWVYPSSLTSDHRLGNHTSFSPGCPARQLTSSLCAS